jgi:ADP-heptose:LPS heptosyltransferase
VTRSEGPTLLILRALGLGDLLTAVPPIRALRRAWPVHELVLAAPRWLTPLVELIGSVDRVLDTAPLTRPAVERPDVAVNLHGKGPDSHRCVLATKPRRVIAFAHPDIPEVSGSPRWNDDEHEVGRWSRLLFEHGYDVDPEDLSLAVPRCEPPQELRGATVIHPGASRGARRWPAERWAAVARREAARGRVIITGSAKELEIAARIASLAELPDRYVLAGRTGLSMLATLIAHAATVMSGDTGVAHLAVAYGTPSITLFGPVPPSLWGPPPRRLQHRVIYKGGRGNPNADTVDSGLLDVGVDDVVRELIALDGLRQAMAVKQKEVVDFGADRLSGVR